MTIASDIMTAKVVTIGQTATVREALKLLAELDVRHLPVVNVQDALVGMISDRDLLRLRRSSEVLGRAVSEVMSADVLVVTPTTHVDEIIDLMTEHRIGALPVVDNESQIVGIVSYVDVLRAAGRAFAQIEPLLTS